MPVIAGRSLRTRGSTDLNDDLDDIDFLLLFGSVSFKLLSASVSEWRREGRVYCHA